MSEKWIVTFDPEAPYEGDDDEYYSVFTDVPETVNAEIAGRIGEKQNADLIAIAPVMRDALRQIAALLKDGETNADGTEFILENDDAVETLHSVIDLARVAIAKEAATDETPRGART